MDTDEVRRDIGAVRARELANAAEVIGYDEVVMLGYRDSGMPDSEANKRPECFAQADLDEAIGRLVAVVRRERPQVMIAYGPNQEGYPHPDHLRVYDVAIGAWHASGDPAKYPDAGEPWEVQKLYYTMWSRKRVVAMHEKFLELGLESPFDEKWFSRPFDESAITTSIDVLAAGDVRRDALLAHETQVDPTSKFWFGLPPEVARTVHPYDDYELGESRVETSTPEDDLFAGITTSVSG
jgi:mycothiol S-conjugate amidase